MAATSSTSPPTNQQSESQGDVPNVVTDAGPTSSDDSVARIFANMGGDADGGAQRRADIFAEPAIKPHTREPFTPQANTQVQDQGQQGNEAGGNADEKAEDAALRKQVAATVAQAGSEPEPKKPAADPRIAELEAQLADAQAKLAARPKEPEIKQQESEVEQPEPSWRKSVSHRLANIAKQELGDDVPQYLIDEYTDTLVQLAQAEGFVDSADEKQARAAQNQVTRALSQARHLRNEAHTYALQAELKALKEKQAQPQQVQVLPETRQRHVESMLQDPKLAEHLGQFPHLSSAIKAGAFDPMLLTDGIDWEASWEDINAQAERNMRYADNTFSRTRYGEAQAQQPKSPPPAGNENTPSGARVSNPAAFAPRRDEPTGTPQRRGPGTVQESTERIAAQLHARRNSQQIQRREATNNMPH